MQTKCTFEFTSERSKKFLEEAFNKYKEVNKLPDQEDFEQIVIHLYPYADTMNDEDEELDGYLDSYLCEAHIYFTSQNVVFKTKRVDSIHCSVPSEIRYFKDGSLCVIIRHAVSIHLGQAIIIHPREVSQEIAARQLLLGETRNIIETIFETTKDTK